MVWFVELTKKRIPSVGKQEMFTCSGLSLLGKQK